MTLYNELKKGTLIQLIFTHSFRVKKIPHLELVGDSYSNVLAFTSSDLDIFKISEAMKQRGWSLNNLQKPTSVHICFTAQHIGIEGEFLKDLEDSVKDVVSNPNAYKEGTAAIYGVAATFPDRSLIRDIAWMFVDVLLSR